MFIGRAMLAAAAIALVAFAGVVTWRILEAEIEAEIYRERLGEISGDLTALREQYNEAVRKTAVTELVVEGNTLSVTIRGGDGSRQTFPTPFDPSREIYVDYVVVDGRLWIRRIFDEQTAPDRGLLIDPGLAQIDWNRVGASHGKATYRALHDGRWVVSVSGDGSLGLAPSPVGVSTPLSPPPPVRDYTPVAAGVSAALRKLETQEIAQALARRILSPRDGAHVYHR